MKDVLIGSGYYSNLADSLVKEQFALDWYRNTTQVSSNIVIADNSEVMCSLHTFARKIRINRNLGHACDPPPLLVGKPLLGWSISWMIPSLVAYSEGCDFIYKEQDCLAFGDWLPIVRRGCASFGRNDVMPCEQSLFYLRHDFILTFLRDYLLIGGNDHQISTEDKFRRVMDSYSGAIEFHDLPGGRNRPLPDFSKPFYLQKITDSEMEQLRKADLI